jgi:hypothetical protein
MVAGRGVPVKFDRPLNLKSVDEVAQWVDAQLLTLERVFNEGAIYVRVVPIHTEPDKPRDGMLVYADGTDWNPGAGEGIYGYVNGAWSKL